MDYIPVSLCIIVKDEAEQLRRCVDSAKDYVNDICITITTINGVADKKTEEVARSFNSRVSYFEWTNDFSAARNYNFSQAIHDTILWLDSDDVLEGGENIRDVIKKTFSLSDDHMVMFPYNYEIDRNGLVVSAHWRERICNRKCFKWVGRIHETFIPVKPFSLTKCETIVVTHLHDYSKSREKHERNLAIFLDEIKGQPEDTIDPRTMYYLGNTYRGIDDLDKALKWYEKYVLVSGWDDEVYLAYVRMADIYHVRRDYERAKEMALKGLSIKPKLKEAYFKLGQIAYQEKKLDVALFWLEQCIRLPHISTELVQNPRNYDYNPLILMSDILFRMGRFEESAAVYRKLKEFTPDVKQVDYSLNMALQQINIQRGANAICEAAEYCLQNEELANAETIINSAPVEVKETPQVRAMQARAKMIMDRIREYENGNRTISKNMLPHVKPDLDKEKKYNLLRVGLKEYGAKTVLDVGTFNGWLANALGVDGYKVTGVDISDETLDIAKREAKECESGVAFLKVNYKELPEKVTEKYDAVVCFDVLEHVLDPELLINNLSAVCAESGYIYINIPNGAWHKGDMDFQVEDLWEHAHSYKFQDLVYLLNGFEDLRIYELEAPAEAQLKRPGQSSLFAVFKNQRRAGKNICIYCGNTAEEWNPEKEKTGIGGSEEAVINLSRELVKAGNRVTVFNNGDSAGGIWDGVCYVDFNKFDITKEYDVFIGWRMPQYMMLPISAKQKYLWLHDVPQPEWFQEQLLNKIDKIMVLSKWHRNCLPDVPDDKFFITGNGINQDHFTLQVDRNAKKVVYASSPDRGLDVLLTMWPDVRKEVPDAELHVFYGWGVYDALRTAPWQKKWKQDVVAMMNQPGVIDRGRVGHEELAKEFMSAGVWAYPTYFGEISCITAMKAQAAGCIPVTTNYAALDETVRFGRKVEGNIRDEGKYEEFKKTLIETLKDSSKYNRNIIANTSIRDFSWRKVAEDWVGLFDRSKN